MHDVILVDDQEGGWLLVRGGPEFTVFRVEADLNLTNLGSFEGDGGCSEIVDARMIAPGLLHCFWSKADADECLRMRSVDFDLNRKVWLHHRSIQQLDKSVVSAHHLKIMQLADKTLHYTWNVNTYRQHAKPAGAYYHSETHGKTLKFSDECQFGAVPLGNRLVVCATKNAAPKTVSFRVIHNGTVHAPTELVITNDSNRGLDLEYMALATSSNRIWFMNTLATDMIYELRLGDRKEQK